MEVSSNALWAGIASTQVGDPLPHFGEGPSHRVSLHRDVGLARLLALDAKDEEAGDAAFGRKHFTEGRGHFVALAEVCPFTEDLGLGLSMLASGGRGGEVERSVQISLEDTLDGTWSSCQGWSWG